MRSLELFAGIGGITLGLELAGVAEPVAFCEIDPYARAVERKHWPEVRQYDDVRSLSADALARDGITGIDLIAGGFPCQPFSTAGLRQGEEDPRHLWPQFARLIGEIRPRWVVAENVPGLLSQSAGSAFGTVLRDLAALGYDAEWHCFPAAAVGAHHLRNRVWIVAYAQHWGCEAGGLPLRTSPEKPGIGQCSTDVANPYSEGFSGRISECSSQAEHANPAHGSAYVAYAMRSGREKLNTPTQPGSAGYCSRRGHAPDWTGGNWEQPSPTTVSAVRGMADGLSGRVDRLRCLGNAVVPQAARVIGEAIKDAEECRRLTGQLPERIVRPEHFKRARGIA